MIFVLLPRLSLWFLAPLKVFFHRHDVLFQVLRELTLQRHKVQVGLQFDCLQQVQQIVVESSYAQPFVADNLHPVPKGDNI